MKFGWTAYFVPFLFVYSPTLILLGDPADIVMNVVTAIVGTYLASLGVVGYFTRLLNPLFRLILVASGLAAMLPYEIFPEAGMVNGIGVAAGLIVIFYEFTVGRRRAATTETP